MLKAKIKFELSDSQLVHCRVLIEDTSPGENSFLAKVRTHREIDSKAAERSCLRPYLAIETSFLRDFSNYQRSNAALSAT